MSQGRRPTELPEWHALRREAALVSQLLGAGTTALGRGSHGNGIGEYYTAFFGLSIGIERLAKLILITDHAIKERGVLPSQTIVKRYGHKLKALCEEAENIVKHHNLSLIYPKPNEKICWNIIGCLDFFADASAGRYANFDAIGNPQLNPDLEPVRKWWLDVAEPILQKHYRGSSAKAKAQLNAFVANALMGDSTYVLQTDEKSQLITDVATLSERSDQVKWVQKFGRFYTLCVVRWLSNVFDSLARLAFYDKHIDALFGHNEFFACYRGDNKYLLNRKVWPPR